MTYASDNERNQAEAKSGGLVFGILYGFCRSTHMY